MKRNLSDAIAQYIKALIARSHQQQIEIQRSELARTFNCVPSQVNYVIRTRFREADGFITESKRGGQGFIRITRCQAAETRLAYEALLANIERLDRERTITARETELLKYIYRWGVMELPPQYAENFFQSISKALIQVLK